MLSINFLVEGLSRYSTHSFANSAVHPILSARGVVPNHSSVGRTRLAAASPPAYHVLKRRPTGLVSGPQVAVGHREVRRVRALYVERTMETLQRAHIKRDANDLLLCEARVRFDIAGPKTSDRRQR
jgi:hypothetical protein